MNILNLASVQDVRRQMPSTADTPRRLSIRRFRPNIIVTGAPAYGEERWQRVRIGHHTSFTVACRTSRCTLPNVDPDTGAKHRSEPNQTLRKYRAGQTTEGKAACFLGMHMVPVDAHGGLVRVGELVVEEGEGAST